MQYVDILGFIVIQGLILYQMYTIGQAVLILVGQ